MLLLLILVFSPYSFGYFNTWLLYPLAVLVDLCLRAPAGSRERAVFVGTLAVSLLLLAMTLPLKLFEPAQAVGNVLLSQLLMLAALGWAIRREPADAAAAEAGRGFQVVLPARVPVATPAAPVHA